jgi:hypothetical protein
MKNKMVVSGGYYSVFFDFRLLKVNYCCHCGQNLKISRVNYIRLIEYALHYRADHEKNYFYHCDKCNYYIKYKNQKKISKMQSEKGSLKLPNSKKIISQEKVDFKKVDNDLVLLDLKKVKK